MDTSQGHSVTNLDDNRLVELIEQATNRLLIMTPGVSDVVADALVTKWKKLGGDRVQVIVDVDPEPCRIGYGTIEGVKKLREGSIAAGGILCHQPGVRIGLIISDETTVIFTPPPLLVEAGSTQPERPNAIQLSSPPKELERDVGLGEEPNKERVVGLDPVRPDKVKNVEQDLEKAPPVKFDLARRVRVFTTRFQFIELQMTGCYISRKKVPIPSSLVGLARNREVESQFHAHFNLVNKGKLEVVIKNGRIISEKTLMKMRNGIEKDFLIPLKGYGSVVLRANKKAMMDEIESLEADVESFAQGVKEKLQGQMDDSAKALIDALFPTIKQNPPNAYKKIHGNSVPDDYLKERLEEDISRAFGNADDLVKDMQVKVVPKDVAYELLVDGEFLKLARASMPGVDFLHDEYDVAPSAEEKGEES